MASKKPITHALLVIDMSGSMGPLAPEVRGGFNGYIKDLRESEGRYRVTATVFDTEFESLCVAAKPKDVPQMTETNYMPRGMTALADAIGKTIVEFEAATTLGDDDKVILVVNTDGLENSSQEFNSWQVAEMIKSREAGGKWMTVYLGAGLAAWGRGRDIGIKHGVNTTADRHGTRSSWSGTSLGTRAYAAGAGRTGTYSIIQAEATKAAEPEDGTDA